MSLFLIKIVQAHTCLWFYCYWHDVCVLLDHEDQMFSQGQGCAGPFTKVLKDMFQAHNYI